MTTISGGHLFLLWFIFNPQDKHKHLAVPKFYEITKVLGTKKDYDTRVKQGDGSRPLKKCLL